jgi:HD superfamily phosphohydrolase
VDPYRYKILTDPVHGAIGLSEFETAVVNSPTFQRLRRLKQLGLASLVYPNADHSRFAHSLGVFHIMGRAIDTLIHKGRLQAEDKPKLRLAALLHDVGHYPYSHLMERLDDDPLRHAWIGAGGVPPVRYPDHEELGQLLVTGRSDLTALLSRNGFDPAEIAKIFRGAHGRPTYNDLVHSSLDLDRMDYLIRDAISTGVPFGRIDLEYLLTHLDTDKNGKLGLEPKATTAAEHCMLARYFMSKVVYFHKTVFAFEALLRQILFLLRRDGRLWPDGQAIRRVVTDETQFARFHDGYIDALIDEVAARTGSLSLLCRCLRLRRRPLLIKEFRTLERKNGPRSETVIRFQTRRGDRLPDLAARHGIPIECFLWEDPKDISLEKVGPFVGITSELRPEETEELLRIVAADGTSRPLITDENSLVHHLSPLRLRTTRLYVVTDEPLDAGKTRAIRDEVEGWGG